MSVPEASVDKDRFPSTREDEIWRTREISAMYLEPKAEAMRKRAHEALGASVLRLDARHERAASLRRKAVHHMGHVYSTSEKMLFSFFLTAPSRTRTLSAQRTWFLVRRVSLMIHAS